jgi:hypothetical protein
MTTTRTVKVAIVGSGLAGLTSAYTLSKQSDNGHGVHFDIHLFEKVCVSDAFQTTAPIQFALQTSNLGMDFSSISIPVTGTDHEWRVDVPMRSFQGGVSAFYSVHKRFHAIASIRLLSPTHRVLRIPWSCLSSC